MNLIDILMLTSCKNHAFWVGNATMLAVVAVVFNLIGMFFIVISVFNHALPIQLPIAYIR